MNTLPSGGPKLNVFTLALGMSRWWGAWGWNGFPDLIECIKNEVNDALRYTNFNCSGLPI